MAQTRSSDCLHDCSDPTWGGEGTCNTSSDPPVCLCDDGFAWREDMGHAGCYPRWKLVAGYVALAVTSFLTSAVLVWQANKFRYLPAGLSASRRRILTRLRALISCSVYVGGVGCTSIILAALQGEADFDDVGFLQAEYVVLVPSIVFAVVMYAEFWVETLPSQLLTPGSLADKARRASEERNIFIIVGGLNAGAISILGVLTFFFPVWPRLAAAVAGLLGGLIACLAVLFVAINMTVVINSTQASETSMAFYAKAKKNIWLQAFGLCIVVGAEMVLGIVNGVNVAGQHASVTLWYMQILAAHAGALLFALTTSFHAPSVARTTGVLLPRDTNSYLNRLFSNSDRRRAFASGGAARFADMPLKHLVRLRLRRADTESDQESDLSDTTVDRQDSGGSHALRRSSSSFGVRFAPVRGDLGGVAAWRGRCLSGNNGTERGDGDARLSGTASALNSSTTLTGNEGNHTTAIDERLSSHVAYCRRSPKYLRPVIVKRPPGQANGLASTAWKGASALGGVAGGSLGLHGESTSRAVIKQQQEEMLPDPAKPFPPRGSNPTGSASRVSSILTGRDAPATGNKIVPFESV